MQSGLNSPDRLLADFDLALAVNGAVVERITSSPETGEVGTGQQVALTLSMSEGVTVDTTSGSPTLALGNGAIATYDANASNPSAGTLVFDYTVGGNDYTTDLAVSVFERNGAIVQDALGVAVDLSGQAG